MSDTKFFNTKNKLCVFFVFFVLNSFGISAQSTATEIETLLETEAVTYAQAARVVLDAANKLTTTNYDRAFFHAEEQGWLPKNATPDTEARLDGVALLCVRSFEIKGGLFFMMMKQPLHAYRELVYKNVITGRSDPAMKVSGDQLLFIVGRLSGEHDREPRVPSARERKRERERLARDLRARREALAADISSMLIEQNVADTTAEATSEGVVITLSNIQFLADSAQLIASERAKLRQLSAVLSTIPNLKLLFTGHTAQVGNEDNLTSLSHDRAQSVANFLISQGVCRPSDIIIVGMGSDIPVADNSTEAGRAANRRVEITILEN